MPVDHFEVIGSNLDPADGLGVLFTLQVGVNVVVSDIPWVRESVV